MQPTSSDDPLAGFEEVQRELERKQEQLDETSRELAELRVTATCADKAVIVTVDGNGELLDLSISDSAMSKTQPKHLGPKVVEAVQNARGKAAEESLPKLSAILPFVSAGK